MNKSVFSVKNISLFLVLFFAAFAITTLVLIIKQETSGRKIPNNQTLITSVPSLTKNPPTPTPEPMPFTGTDDAANEQYLSEHPELVTEAQLHAKLPLEYDGFTLDYSYPEDKFTVKLAPPLAQSKQKFENWKKDSGLTDPNRFIIQ